jgi:LL-diaminopimelate aminotransferase
MAGWRIGFVAGNAEVIAGLAQIKTNIDSGVFNACQEAGIAALDAPEPFCSDLRAMYQKRRDLLVPALRAIGLDCKPPEATFYVWTKAPKGIKSQDYVLDLIKNKGVVATPGTGFGPAGEGYVRFTLCSDISVLKQVADILGGRV